MQQLAEFLLHVLANLCDHNLDTDKTYSLIPQDYLSYSKLLPNNRSQSSSARLYKSVRKFVGSYYSLIGSFANDKAFSKVEANT